MAGELLDQGRLGPSVGSELPLPLRRPCLMKADDKCSAAGSILTEADAQQLRDTGFVVIDGFLSDSLAATLRSEAVELATAGRMPQHRFQFGASQFAKPHIFEADLHDEVMQEALPEFANLLFDDSLAKCLELLLPDLGLEIGPRTKSLKLQRNCGRGGCFPAHYDNAGRPSRRAVTCVVYLNPDWRQGDGGELVLHPFLRKEVVVAPAMGRAALFRSDRILHSVRPAVAERFCFTIWLDSSDINRDSDCNLTAKHLSTDPLSVASLMQSPASLIACMEGAEGCEEMLQEHRQHVQSQQTHPQLGPFIKHLRHLKSET
ncbi:unnamed protein product [Polarella glacialis]|uniref:Fe2OG dioxygenase domain-containing protein n=1 Tax=Polarella glacialis TaxID=89957 RepID=A0A813GZ96_POLGL|nr:unnamed protein product [Polarella glacialis]